MAGYDIVTLLRCTPHVLHPPKLYATKTMSISEQINVLIMDAVRAICGGENVLALGLFGSRVDTAYGRHSDLDFVLVLRDVPTDLTARDRISPNIKERLRQLAVPELCAFNIFSAGELERADRNRSWLLATIRSKCELVYDPQDFLGNLLQKHDPDVAKIDDTFWMGVASEDISWIHSVEQRHTSCHGALVHSFPSLASYHRGEAYYGALLASVMQHGIYSSRASQTDLASMLVETGASIDLEAVWRHELKQQVEVAAEIYAYDAFDQHLAASRTLLREGVPLEAVSHAYLAVKALFHAILHQNQMYAIGGELTQLILQRFTDRLPAELRERINLFCYPACQILGRSGYVSFDLRTDGSVLREDPSHSPYAYAELVGKLGEIARDLAALRPKLGLELSRGTEVPSVTVLIQEGPAAAKVRADLQRLVFPSADFEIVESDHAADLGRLIYAISLDPPPAPEAGTPAVVLGAALPMCRGDYVAFVPGGRRVSPFWLVQLLARFTDRGVAAVYSPEVVCPAPRERQEDGAPTLPRRSSWRLLPGCVRRELVREWTTRRSASATEIVRSLKARSYRFRRTPEGTIYAPSSEEG